MLLSERRADGAPLKVYSSQYTYLRTEISNKELQIIVTKVFMKLV